jgi:hypothetical protein
MRCLRPICQRGLGDLCAVDLKLFKIGAKNCHLSVGSQRAAQNGCQKKQEFRIRHSLTFFSTKRVKLRGQSALQGTA